MAFDDIDEARFKNATGTAIRFTAIEGVGEKTAQKLRRVRGVNAPRDVQEYSAEELAREAGISKQRATKVIRGAGGNPGYSETGRPSAIGAGNIAEGLDKQKQESARSIHSLGRERVTGGLMAGAKNVERQEGISVRRKADQSDLTELPENDLLELGRISDSFSKATADPFEPGQSAAISVEDETRERAATAQIAARRELGGRGYGRDEITSEFSKKPSGEFMSGLLSGFFAGGNEIFNNHDIDREEYGRAKEIQESRSPQARRVDARRKAPVTDEISTWSNDPSHWDYPGLDRPQDYE